MKRFRQSFRFRIIALTILVSGTVLLAFGVASRYALYRIKVQTVDGSLRTLPFPNFPHPDDMSAWTRFAEATGFVSSRIFHADVHLLVYGKDYEAYFKSEYWPSEISARSLPPAVGDVGKLSLNRMELGPNPWGDIRRERDGFLLRRPPAGTEGRPRRGRMLVEPLLETRKSSSGPLRFGVYRFEGYNVALGVELRGVAEEMVNVKNAFLLSLPVALIVLAAGAWVIASRAIRPIRKLTEAASEMSVKRLDERIAESDEDREFSDLIKVFNGMLERLERSFRQATRFSADAAHELKTPLTILQGHLESALQEAPDGSEQQRKLGMLLEETQRLRGITRRLLLLAQADAGQLKVNGEPMRMGELLSELVEDFELQSPDTRFSISMEGDDHAFADRSLTTQILQNLLSNAVKYNDEANPWVEIRCAEGEAVLRIEVANGGPGIPEACRDRVFDRFARVDSARNRRVDGFGLGLSLSREFVRAIGGELDLAESGPGRTRFQLILPKSSAVEA